MSVRNGCTIEIYGFTHSLHTFLACAAHNAIMMEVEDWEDSSLVPKHYAFVACTTMHMRIPSILCIHVNNDAYEGKGGCENWCSNVKTICNNCCATSFIALPDCLSISSGV